MHKLLSFIFLCFLIHVLNAQSSSFLKQLDSIQELRKLSNNIDLDIEIRIEYAEKAVELSNRIELDSTILISKKNQMEFFFNIKDYDKLKNVSLKKFNLAKKHKDTINIAFCSNLLGEYYYSSIENARPDSCYYYYNISFKTYKNIKDHFSSAIILHRIAALQLEEKDYVGSEINLIQVLVLLNSYEKSNVIQERKYFVYNNLGIAFNYLKQYEKAIKYHKKAIELYKGVVNNKRSLYPSYHNLSTIYRDIGKHAKSIKEYHKMLKDQKFKEDDPSFYSLVLGNYAHSLFLSKKEEQLPELFLRALKIADGIHANHSITIRQYLSEYYNYKKNKDSALYYAHAAKTISKKFYKDDYLESLLLLSRLETDSIAVKYYEAYIKLNDSIQHQERLIRNKFARIQFETDEYIQETQELNTQNRLITTIGGSVILILALLYFIKRQNSKNNQLRF